MPCHNFYKTLGQQNNTARLIQASCSTLTAAAGMDDSLIRVELSGDTLTVSEPTHMSWDEVHHRLIIIYTLMTYYWSSCVWEFA